MKAVNMFVTSIAILLASPCAQATNHDSSYTMMGSTTDLMPFDVEYDFQIPITLTRIKTTFPLHQIQFTVNRSFQVCVRTEMVCVARDEKGNCTQWQQQCVEWGYQTTPVQKTIELDFASLPALGDKESETYTLIINRMRPGGDGEDWVTSSFDAVQTKAPVSILRWSDFRYQIDLKKK
jgi:hypothetical protein